MIFDGFTHLFFDFDGTLCESELDIRLAWVQTFAAIGRKLPDNMDIIFKNGPQLMPMIELLIPGVDEATKQHVAEIYRDAYFNSPFENTVPYPRIDKMLRGLCGRGAKLFVVTNKSEYPTLRLIRKYGWEELFTLVVCPDTDPGRHMDKTRIVEYALKHGNARKETSLMVGDSATDIAAGHANGLKAAGVLWGNGTKEELAAAGAEYLIAFDDLSKDFRYS